MDSSLQAYQLNASVETQKVICVSMAHLCKDDLEKLQFLCDSTNSKGVVRQDNGFLVCTSKKQKLNLSKEFASIYRQSSDCGFTGILFSPGAQKYRCFKDFECEHDINEGVIAATEDQIQNITRQLESIGFKRTSCHHEAHTIDFDFESNHTLDQKRNHNKCFAIRVTLYAHNIKNIRVSFGTKKNNSFKEKYVLDQSDVDTSLNNYLKSIDMQKFKGTANSFYLDIYFNHRAIQAIKNKSRDLKNLIEICELIPKKHH
ncbi:hypothetical protein I3271_07520 [Photobacterium leiognathi]|uniref:hypothetical protein n=1 Tax=Photobacterium leiognathi TaxID=553611 RepID=UPI001EDE3A67|nr:hypothetical protein [Photobacterium leiognathi]MCG3884535.1 hypothetical protein [Photobacterium leiognathi]